LLSKKSARDRQTDGETNGQDLYYGLLKRPHNKTSIVLRVTILEKWGLLYFWNRNICHVVPW